MKKFYMDKTTGIVHERGEWKRIEIGYASMGYAYEKIKERIKSGELIEVIEGNNGEWISIEVLHDFM